LNTNNGVMYVSADKGSAPNTPMATASGSQAGLTTGNSAMAEILGEMPLAAGEAIRICVYPSVAGETFYNRYMELTPIRVG
jgi:hypothetical protein